MLSPPWQTLQPSRPAIRQERRVPTEELVTPVPAQHHGDAPSSRLREPVQQQKRAVDERLIEQIAHALQKHFSVLHGELDFRMVRAAMAGDRPSERPLIVAGLGKAEAECLHGSPPARQGGNRSHRTRIDPTTQEQPERDITDELRANRSLELLPERSGPLGRIQRLVRGE